MFVVLQGLAVRWVQMDLMLLSLSIKVFEFGFRFSLSLSPSPKWQNGRYFDSGHLQEKGEKEDLCLVVHCF